MIFGSEVFPSAVLEEIGRATGARYEDTLRDDDLPGAPGDAGALLARPDALRLRHHDQRPGRARRPRWRPWTPARRSRTRRRYPQ